MGEGGLAPSIEGGNQSHSCFSFTKHSENEQALARQKQLYSLFAGGMEGGRGGGRQGGGIGAYSHSRPFYPLFLQVLRAPWHQVSPAQLKWSRRNYSRRG